MMLKTHTSIEQSKQLLKLGIEPNTADAVYVAFRTKDGNMTYDYAIKDGTLDEEDVPAWTLSILIEMLPKYIEFHNTEYEYRYDYIHKLSISYDCYKKKWICGYKANDWAAHIEENELLFDGIFNLVCYILNGIYKLEKINSDEES